ncbi:MAG: SPOR domain-containing protein [Candidatus Marinimicrobia bacterium]|nr:SPOR domain-containing protein [Candidatus Neomarinimicrobiota bacterium]
MKKYTVALVVIFMIILSVMSCSKKQPASVGEAIDITITEQTENITKYLWAFKTKPAESKLDPRDFLPSDDAEAVSFIPDVPGDYDIIVAMIDSDGEEFNETFAYEVSGAALSVVDEEGSETTDKFVEKSEPEQQEEVKEIPESEVVEKKELKTPAAPVAVEKKKTTKEEGKNWREVPESAISVKAGKTRSSKKTASVSNKAASIPGNRSKFTVQVSSFRIYERAQNEVADLKKDGFNATIQRVYFKDIDEIWYRVRVGNFNSSSDARSEMTKIKRKTSRDCWVDNVREDT